MPHCTAPHCAVPHRAAPRRTAPHRTAPHRTPPHRTAPHPTPPHRTPPHHTPPPTAPLGEVDGVFWSRGEPLRAPAELHVVLIDALGPAPRRAVPQSTVLRPRWRGAARLQRCGRVPRRRADARARRRDGWRAGGLWLWGLDLVAAPTAAGALGLDGSNARVVVRLRGHGGDGDGPHARRVGHIRHYLLVCQLLGGALCILFAWSEVRTCISAHHSFPPVHVC